MKRLDFPVKPGNDARGFDITARELKSIALESTEGGRIKGRE